MGNRGNFRGNFSERVKLWKYLRKGKKTWKFLREKPRKPVEIFIFANSDETWNSFEFFVDI